MLANEEAAAHYARALEVLERSHPEALRRRCDLLLELGEAHVRSGERPRAWTTFREAAALAAELGRRRRWRGRRSGPRGATSSRRGSSTRS